MAITELYGLRVGEGSRSRVEGFVGSDGRGGRGLRPAPCGVWEKEGPASVAEGDQKTRTLKVPHRGAFVSCANV